MDAVNPSFDRSCEHFRQTFGQPDFECRFPYEILTLWMNSIMEINKIYAKCERLGIKSNVPMNEDDATQFVTSHNVHFCRNDDQTFLPSDFTCRLCDDSYGNCWPPFFKCRPVGRAAIICDNSSCLSHMFNFCCFATYLLWRFAESNGIVSAVKCPVNDCNNMILLDQLLDNHTYTERHAKYLQYHKLFNECVTDCKEPIWSYERFSHHCLRTGKGWHYSNVWPTMMACDQNGTMKCWLDGDSNPEDGMNEHLYRMRRVKGIHYLPQIGEQIAHKPNKSSFTKLLQNGLV